MEKTKTENKENQDIVSFAYYNYKDPKGLILITGKKYSRRFFGNRYKKSKIYKDTFEEGMQIIRKHYGRTGKIIGSVRIERHSDGRLLVLIEDEN